MSTLTKRSSLAAAVVAGLMILGAACGGSSSKTDDASATSQASTTSVAPGGATASQCADLETYAAEMSASMNSMATDGTTDLDAITSQLDGFSSKVPDALKADWQIVVESFKNYATSMNGVDMTNLSDPATITKMSDAAKDFDSAKFQTAADDLEAWTTANCAALNSN